MNNNKSSKKKVWFGIILTIFVISLSAVALIFYFKEGFNFKRVNSDIYAKDSGDGSSDTNKHLSKEYLKAVLPETDTNEKSIKYSDYESYSKAIAEDDSAGMRIKRIYSGKRINIAVTGVDSRLGDSYRHADANHVISILVDSGKIEIISVPRDTYSDAGYDDTTGQNKLTIVRAAKGQKTYLKELARIAEIDKIHYFVEFGFSQAIGLIEMLGHSNAAGTLRVLRSRTGLGGDDFQRVYTQAQFIKQNLLSNFENFNSFKGDLIIRAGLALVETDLTASKVTEIRDILKSKNFGQDDDVTIKIRPPFPVKFKIYDLNNPEVIAALTKKIDSFNESHNHDSVDTDIDKVVTRRLTKTIENTIKSKYAQSNIRAMNTLYQQRAWLQISDLHLRDSIRDLFCQTLIKVYLAKKDSVRSKAIQNYLELEKKVLKSKENLSTEKINSNY